MGSASEQLNVAIQHQHLGLLDYKWDTRVYLSKINNKLDEQYKELIHIIVSPFVQLILFQKQLNNDPSLKAVCSLCTDLPHVKNVNHPDKQLRYLSQLFNELIHSARGLHMCYDCGTVARGTFLQIIKAYRGSDTLNNDEIIRMRNDYHMDKYQGIQGIIQMEHRLNTTKRNCVFLCALQLGDESGHIYVIEKIYKNKRPRYRLFQSCLNAYLLIDYIEYMGYLHNPLMSINISAHLNALKQLLSTAQWSSQEEKIFINWFKFKPPSGHKSTDKKLFTFTHILL